MKRNSLFTQLINIFYPVPLCTYYAYLKATNEKKEAESIGRKSTDKEKGEVEPGA
jgi:hypothetical protein